MGVLARILMLLSLISLVWGAAAGLPSPSESTPDVSALDHEDISASLQPLVRVHHHHIGKRDTHHELFEPRKEIVLDWLLSDGSIQSMHYEHGDSSYVNLESLQSHGLVLDHLPLCAETEPNTRSNLTLDFGDRNAYETAKQAWSEPGLLFVVQDDSCHEAPGHRSVYKSESMAFDRESLSVEIGARHLSFGPYEDESAHKVRIFIGNVGSVQKRHADESFYIVPRVRRGDHDTDNPSESDFNTDTEPDTKKRHVFRVRRGDYDTDNPSESDYNTDTEPDTKKRHGFRVRRGIAAFKKHLGQRGDLDTDNPSESDENTDTEPDTRKRHGRRGDLDTDNPSESDENTDTEPDTTKRHGRRGDLDTDNPSESDENTDTEPDTRKRHGRRGDLDTDNPSESDRETDTEPDTRKRDTRKRNTRKRHGRRGSCDTDTASSSEDEKGCGAEDTSEAEKHKDYQKAMSETFHEKDGGLAFEKRFDDVKSSGVSRKTLINQTEWWMPIPEVTLVNSYARMDFDLSIGITFDIDKFKGPLSKVSARGLGSDPTMGIKDGLQDMYIMVEAKEEMAVRLQAEIVAQFGYNVYCYVWLFPYPGIWTCSSGPILANQLFMIDIPGANNAPKGGFGKMTNVNGFGVTFLAGFALWTNMQISANFNFTTPGLELSVPKGSKAGIGIKDGEPFESSFDGDMEWTKPSFHTQDLKGSLSIGVGPSLSLSFGAPHPPSEGGGAGGPGSGEGGPGSGESGPGSGESKRGSGNEDEDVANAVERRFVRPKHFPPLGLYAKIALPEIVFKAGTIGDVDEDCKKGGPFKRAVFFGIDIKIGPFAGLDIATWQVDTSWIKTGAKDMLGLQWVKNLWEHCWDITDTSLGQWELGIEDGLNKERGNFTEAGVKRFSSTSVAKWPTASSTVESALSSSTVESALSSSTVEGALPTITVTADVDATYTEATRVIVATKRPSPSWR